jgi:hypothetical protein
MGAVYGLEPTGSRANRRATRGARGRSNPSKIQGAHMNQVIYLVGLVVVVLLILSFFGLR